MALNGSHPVLIFWLQSSGLTNDEAAELQALISGTQDQDLTGTEAAARIEALKAKSKAAYEISRTPIPIILDSRITSSYVDNQGISMNKALSYVDANDDENNDIVTKSSNYLSLSVQVAKNEKIYSLIVNACIAISQFYFNKPDAVANVSYFSAEAIIMDGYMTGFNRQNIKGSTKDQITLQISNLAKDKTYKVPKAEAPQVTIPDLS